MCFGGFGRVRKRWMTLCMIKGFKTGNLPGGFLINQSFIRFCISIILSHSCIL